MRERNGKQPVAEDVAALCSDLQKLPYVAGYELLRIYYYDARPVAQILKRPVSQDEYNSADEPEFEAKCRFFDDLATKPNFALRMGDLAVASTGWRIKPAVPKKLLRQPRPLSDDDFIIAVQQKGVDMRIGMDMARLALRQMVSQIIVVTGDVDFAPAFEFVRDEGVRVVLDTLGQNGSKGLRQHADIVIEH